MAAVDKKRGGAEVPTKKLKLKKKIIKRDSAQLINTEDLVEPAPE
jgi:hypothetical protein